MARARAASEKRRPQILGKAAQLFRKKGFHATSMDEVAGALKLNKATIYHHFPGGKSDLLYGINVEALDDLFARLESHDADAEPEARLRLTVRDMIATAAERPDAVIVYYEESRWLKQLLRPEQFKEIRARERAYRDTLVEIVRLGVESGAFRDRDPEAVAGYILAAVPVASPALGGDADVVCDLLLGGLAAASESLHAAA